MAFACVFKHSGVRSGVAENPCESLILCILFRFSTENVCIIARFHLALPEPHAGGFFISHKEIACDIMK